MEKKKRLQKRVKRIDDRFIKKGGQTDMDIAEHEARLKRLADKGGFTPPHEGWNAIVGATGSPLNQDGGKWGQRSPGTGWSQKEKLEDPAGHSKAVSEGFKEGLPLVLGAIPVPAVGGAVKGAQVLGAVGPKVGSKSGKVMKGIVDKYGARAKTFLEKEKFSKRAKTFLEKEIKRSKPGKSGITKSSQREMLHGKPRYPSSRNLMKSSKNVTPTGANPRSRIHGEHVSPKGEALGSYQYRSTGFGGGGRVWEPTKKSVGKIQKKLDAPSGYYRSDAKGWPLSPGKKGL